MEPTSTKDVDPTDSDHREVGAGLLDEQMGPSSAMAHLYRGEIHRMKYWRERLDRTSNWAVIVMSGVLTWGFSGSGRPHYILPSLSSGVWRPPVGPRERGCVVSSV
nr:DUF2270 domain-containing protein [Halosolutus halophilus]